MGLDMYLSAKKCLMFMKPSTEYTNMVESMGVLFPETKTYPVTYLECCVGYWRKANAIHCWFVKNVQDGKDDCQESYVTMANLKCLLETVNKVLDNMELASELLPTTKGLFFGGTEYDDRYKADLQKTKTLLENIINEDTFKEWNFYYRSSW